MEGQCHYFNFSFGRVFWLGPHEWLISTNNDLREIAAYFNDNFSNEIALSDVTDGYCELSLEGESLLKILKQAMTCDLRDFNLEEDTESNKCVQTNFAKMPVVFWKNSKFSEGKYWAQTGIFFENFFFRRKKLEKVAGFFP